MTILKMTLTTIVFLTVASFANAQIIDFSGTWTRNDDKTQTQMSINSIPVILEIKQNGNALTIKRNSKNGAGDTSSYTEIVKTDGTVSTALTPSKLKRSTTGQWSTDQKSFSETYTSTDDQETIQQNGKLTFSLSADGKELTISGTQKYGDQAVDVVEIFEKQ